MLKMHYITFIEASIGLVVFLLNGVASIPTANPLTEQAYCKSLQLTNPQTEHEQYIDVLQNPCDDFWEYACGNWQVPASLRFAEPTDTLTTMKASNKYLLLKYFEDVENNVVKVNDKFKGLNTFYKTCLANKALKSKAEKQQAIRVYTDVLQNFSSSWPVLQTDYSSQELDQAFSWEFIAAAMRRYGTQALISTKIQPNWQNSQQLIFYLMPPTFEMLKFRPTDTNFDEEAVYLYQRYAKLLMLDLGVKVREANQIAEEIVEFEKSLMSLVPTDQSLVLREPQTLKSLAREIPDLDLKKYFKTLLQDFDLPAHYEDVMLIVANDNYLYALAKFLKTASKETVAKYFIVQFLAQFQVNLNDEFSSIQQKEDCLKKLNDFMPSDLSYLFLELAHGNAVEFLETSQQHLTKMFDNLKQQFEKLLNTTTVFERDPTSKILSIEKLKSMRLLLPSLELGSQAANTYEIGNNYDVSLISLSKLKTSNQFKKTISHMVEDASSITTDSTLSLSSIYGEQTYGPLDVNGYYRLMKNAIELPIGILQAPLYDPCLKSAKIYGGLAYILSHELVHGFDYDGLNYDKYGNVNNGWGPKAIIKFGVKSNCYLNDRYHNGDVTINENIADSEGLRLALETFLESKMEEAFDQEDLKLFFLSFAQIWCRNTSTDSQKFSLHAGHKERVNNVLGNFMEFSDVFKCRPGSKMHPEEKCRIF